MAGRTERGEVLGLVGAAQTAGLEVVDFFVNEVGLNAIRSKVTRKLTGLKPVAYYGCLLVRPPELAGDDDPEDIVRSVPRGLYAKHFGGGQVDITSGKFVFSATEAYLIEDGRIGPPVFGATLIGNGPDVPYPKQHRELWNAVAERGALISEWPPGTAPEPFRFPQRNRILAALSEMVVVVESRERGGSLITARAAADRGIGCIDVNAIAARVDDVVRAALEVD